MSCYHIITKYPNPITFTSWSRDEMQSAMSGPNECKGIHENLINYFPNALTSSLVNFVSS
jgi:hypothetical protein